VKSAALAPRTARVHDLQMLEWLLYHDSQLRLLLASVEAPVVDQLMLGFSGAGARGQVWIGLAALILVLRPWRAAGVWRTFLALGLTFLVNDIVVKPAVGRERPFVVVADVRVVGEQPETLSFPSGHAASSFAGAFALTRVWPAARLPLWALAVLIAFSRIYIGVHYPLDVMFGALVGVGCAYLVLGRATCYIDDPHAVIAACRGSSVGRARD
jgi:undecaprenyl-diphosphatase